MTAAEATGDRAVAVIGSPGVWRAMGPYARQVAGLLTIGSLCGIVMNTAVVLPAVLLGRAIDAVLTAERLHSGGTPVTRAVLLLVAGTVATELPRVGKRFWLGTCKNRIRANVRADALAGVLGWPAARLHTTSVGELMARIVGDVEVLGTGVGEVIVETWDTLLFSASLVAAMLLYDLRLGLVALAPVPVALALSKAVGARVTGRTLRAREANAALTEVVQEGLTGLRVLRVSGRAGAYTKRLRHLADAQAAAELAASGLDAVLATTYTTLVTSGVVAVVWLGGHRVLTGQLTVGALVAFLALFGRFTARAFRIPQMVNRVQAGAAAYSRLAPLLAAPPPAADEPPRACWRTDRVAGLPWAANTCGSGQDSSTPDSGRRPSSSAPPATAPAHVSLRDVVFTYPGAAQPALRGVSLQIPPGALVAVTGPVGAGKSALARLVLGLHQPDSGEVRVDGVDPGHWSPTGRRQVGYLPQGHQVFSGTVADNVLLRDPADPAVAAAAAVAAGRDREAQARLVAALAVAGLTDDVGAMPAGVDTGIGELGVQVSGGQRQRIALARSLAAPAIPPRLLVLDDPFSAVDVDTEARVIAALGAAVGPGARPQSRATVLLCSTRLAAFPDADLVVVLDDGRIAEVGTHAALLAAGGCYARLFRAQRHRQTRYKQAAPPAAAT